MAYRESWRSFCNGTHLFGVWCEVKEKLTTMKGDKGHRSSTKYSPHRTVERIKIKDKANRGVGAGEGAGEERNFLQINLRRHFSFLFYSANWFCGTWPWVHARQGRSVLCLNCLIASLEVYCLRPRVSNASVSNARVRNKRSKSIMWHTEITAKARGRSSANQLRTR